MAAGGRRWLALILLVSLCLNLIGLGWGLPNGNQTWAADALQPLTPMAVGKHVFFGERFSSGWFYFKYPLGHPQVLLAAQAPYLAWLRVRGELHHPSSTYPYGFKHPESALARLALLSRLVSALMGTALVAVAYWTAATLFAPMAGLAAAVLVAGCYPLVFYAHTSNVDVALLFWIALALAAALSSARRDSLLATSLTAVAVAMALLTKEQSLGALAAVPLVWIVWRLGQQPLEMRAVLRHAAVAAAAFAVVTVLVGSIWWNPTGYLNRWRFLLGTLPPEIRVKYAPYQFLVQVPKGLALTHELQHAGKVVGVAAQALTWPVAILALAGLLWAARRHGRAAVLLCVVLVTYHVLSLRALELVPVRYTMPLLYVMLLFAGAAGGALMEAGRRWHRGAAVITAVLVLGLLPGIDVTRLLLSDPRYAAEAWLAAHATPAARVEVYQPATYLPRFGSDFQVKRVPIAERSVAQFRQRAPDFVVLSSGGRAGLTGRYAKDWKPGQAIFSDSQAAQEFLAALRAEQLGYRRVERFHATPHWITPRINSLNPEITIYARTSQ
jgi:4-amino-4-deoxy-L-arabinose transferase-like glycosyltransferase